MKIRLILIFLCVFGVTVLFIFYTFINVDFYERTLKHHTIPKVMRNSGRTLLRMNRDRDPIQFLIIGKSLF